MKHSKRSALNWRDLGVPRPRSELARYKPIDWALGARQPLSSSGSSKAPELAKILSTRRSRRTFAAPASIEDLSALFDLCAKTREIELSDLGFDLEFRRHPSSGAIQSIHWLVQRTEHEAWSLYDGKRHELVSLANSEKNSRALRASASAVLSTSNASLIALAAEPGKCAAKYEAFESLVWRDAGVMLGYLSICAEALGMAFCPLGITGDPEIAELDEEGRLRGVGLALIGRPFLD